MLERRRRFLVRLGQSDPALDAVQAMAGARAPHAPVRSEWAMPRPAVIQFTSPGLISCTEPKRVAVHLRAFEQIGDGGQPDMGMRPHIDALAGREIHRPEIVEEHERADAAPRHLRQEAGDEKTVAQVVRLCR